MASLCEIDIHCHLLPDWDDGPPSLDKAIEMARAAVDSGLRTIFATPHAGREGISRPDRPAHGVPRAVERLQNAIREGGLDLEVRPGAEVTLSPSLPERLSDEPWLLLGSRGEQRYVLVEMPPGAPWTPEVDTVLFQIALSGVTPILAHPERYPDLQRDPTIARRAAARGVLLQVTARALAGERGEASVTARRLASEGLVSFVASDSHSARCAFLAGAGAPLAVLLGEEGAQRVLAENPRRLLEGSGAIVPAAAAPESARPSLLRRLLGRGSRP